MFEIVIQLFLWDGDELVEVASDRFGHYETIWDCQEDMLGNEALMYAARQELREENPEADTWLFGCEPKQAMMS